MSNAATDKIFTALASASPKRSVEFQAFAKVDNTTFKLVLSADRSTDDAAIASEVATQTDGRARVVPGSIARRGNVAVAFVKANALSKPLDAEFTMVTAALASDASGRIWSVVNGEGGKRVVLEAGDDLDGIFKARVNARRNFVNPAAGHGIATASFQNGDHVRYVDVAAGKTRLGVVFNVDGVQTVVGNDMVPTHIAPLQVVSSLPRKSLPAAFHGTVNDFEASAKLSAEKFGEILAYLRKAYPSAAGPMLTRLAEIHSKGA